MTCGKPAVPRSENPNPDESPRFRVTTSSSAMFRAHWSPHCHLTHLHETRTPYTRIIRRPVFISSFSSLPLSTTVCHSTFNVPYVLSLSWHTHEHPHTDQEARAPFANTFRTAPRDRTAPRSLSLSFPLPSPWFFPLFPSPMTRASYYPICIVNDGPQPAISERTRRNATPALFTDTRLENARTSYLCLREPRRRRGNRPRILADDAATSTLPGERLATGWRHLQGILQTPPVLHLSHYVSQNLPATMRLQITLHMYYVCICIISNFKNYT